MRPELYIEALQLKNGLTTSSGSCGMPEITDAEAIAGKARED